MRIEVEDGVCWRRQRPATPGLFSRSSRLSGRGAGLCRLHASVVVIITTADQGQSCPTGYATPDSFHERPPAKELAVVVARSHCLCLSSRFMTQVRARAFACRPGI